MCHDAQGWDVSATVRKVQACGGNLGPAVSTPIKLTFASKLLLCTLTVAPFRTLCQWVRQLTL